MNKYQKYIFAKLHIRASFVFSSCCPVGFYWDCIEYGKFDEKNDAFEIKQDEDITKTQYALMLDLSKEKINPFNGIFVHKDNQWIEAPCVNKQYRILIDFNDRTDAIKFSFINKIADDYILNVTYAEADKEQYYAKLEQEKKNDLLFAASIKVSTGADLVNIYFQPCCDKYKSAKVELYTAEGKFERLGIPNVIPRGIKVVPPKLLGGTVKMMIGQFKVDEGMFFKSITGLAHGVYAIKLIQFDENGNELLRSDNVFFVVR